VKTSKYVFSIFAVIVKSKNVEMIQRIQSIFLLLAGGASLSLFGLPFASTTEAVSSSSLFSDSVYNLMDTPALIALFGLAGLLAIVSIFLFKNRKLQMRLTIFAFIANLLGAIMAIVFYMQNSQDIGEQLINDGAGMYLPLVSFVLLLLAYRFISKDDNLVRSMDRLR